MKASTYHGGLKEITNSLPFSPLSDRCVCGGPCQFPLNLGWTCDSFWPVESGPWKIAVLHLHTRNTASQNPVPEPWEARVKRWGHREGNWGMLVLSGSWAHNPPQYQLPAIGASPQGQDNPSQWILRRLWSQLSKALSRSQLTHRIVGEWWWLV